MIAPRVYADFHNLDDSNRLRLTCAGTLEDLKRQGIELQDGMTLYFYTDDADEKGRLTELVVDGKVQYDSVGECWVAVVDWAALRHATLSGRVRG
jgi:hypothetical protein